MNDWVVVRKAGQVQPSVLPRSAVNQADLDAGRISIIAGPMSQEQAVQRANTLATGGQYGSTRDSELPYFNQPYGSMVDSEMSQTQQASGQGDWVSASRDRARQGATAPRVNNGTEYTLTPPRSPWADTGYSSSDPTSAFNQNQAQTSQLGQGGPPRSSAPSAPVTPGYNASDPTNAFNQNQNQSSLSGGPGGGTVYSGSIDPTYSAGANPVETGSYTGWMSGLGTQDPADLLNPVYGTELYLKQSGMGNHANKGMLQDVYGGYNNLSAMANGGQFLTPDQVALQGGDFLGGLTNSTGGNFVDSRAMWDKQFDGSYGAGINGSTSQSPTAGQDQYQQIASNIQSMAQFMGPQNAQTAMNLVDQAYFDYKSSGAAMAGKMTFIDYLTSIGASNWF